MLLILVILFSCFIVFILVWMFLRRWIHAREYQRIDEYKSLYQEWIDAAVNGNTQKMAEFRYLVEKDGLEREALEQVMFGHSVAEDTIIFPLFKEMGFIQLYEKKLSLKRLTISDRSRAADRLGRMHSDESIDVLFHVLKDEIEKTELAGSIIKAMTLIGSEKALELIVTLFPLLFQKEVLTPKKGEMVLFMFALLHQERLVHILRHFQHLGERVCVLVALDALSRSVVTSDLVAVGMEMLENEDVEIRVRCLRLIANAQIKAPEVTLSKISPHFHATQWFVRLQAIEVARRFLCEESFSQLVSLLKDPHWQVRRAAAAAIVSQGDKSLPTIIDVIESGDTYAKEAICEAIQLEGYVEPLVNHLTQSSLLYNSSARILFYMLSIGLASNVKEIVLNHPSDEIRENLHLLIYPQGGDND
jgi:HEAT repeat protein